MIVYTNPAPFELTAFRSTRLGGLQALALDAPSEWAVLQKGIGRREIACLQTKLISILCSACKSGPDLPVDGRSPN